MKNNIKITFTKAKKMLKKVFPNIDFEFNLVFANIIFATKTLFLDIVHHCCQMKWVYFIRFVSPCRDAGPLVALSRHCKSLSSCTELCKVSSLTGRIAYFFFFFVSTVGRFYGSTVLVGNGLPA